MIQQIKAKPIMGTNLNLAQSDLEECLTIDKRNFDMEYNTQWRKEVNYLKTKGISYTFVKRENEISTYKYAKTRHLFEALASFYYDK